MSIKLQIKSEMRIQLNQKEEQTAKLEDSFDIRIVRYEHIHGIKEEDFDALALITNPKSNEIILDAGCGYGSVSREIIKRNKSKKLNFFLADANQTQLKRAIEEFNGLDFNHNSELKFFIDNLLYTQFKDNSFHTIIAKMVIHEIPQKEQQQAINNAYKILKPGGKMIIWDMSLDEKSQQFIQNIIRMKDKLAGFKTLEKNRYFLRFDETKSLLSNAGFRNIKQEYEILSPIITKKRLTEEFGNNISKLNKWHNFIRKQTKELDLNTIKKMQFEDYGESISFVPHKSIIIAIK